MPPSPFHTARPLGASNFERKAVHDPFIAGGVGKGMLTTQMEGGPRQRLADEIDRAASPRTTRDGRTVRARTLLTEEECAMVESMEAKSGAPVFVRFSMLDTSFEARLDGRVPEGAVAQRGMAGLVTGPAIVGG